MDNIPIQTTPLGPFIRGLQPWWIRQTRNAPGILDNMSMPTAADRFLPGDAVRTHLYGFGRVVSGGRDPIVRFTCGRECHVTGESLEVLTEQRFREVVANRAVIEVWLHLRTLDVRAGIEIIRSTMRWYGELLLRH